MKLELSPEEVLRYSRQLVIPEVGLAGQQKLKESSVLIVGCGGLGSPLALYLAAAGIGRIGIVDYDKVDLSNLHRQVIYKVEDIGKPKTAVVKDHIQAINPEIKVDAYEALFTSKNAKDISALYQVLIDGTDNIPTRYLINDLCVFSGKPYVYGAVYRFVGQVGVFDSTKGACYRCIFPKPPPPELMTPCSVAGVLGVVPGVIGLMQATEVLKILLGIGSPLINSLVLYDALENQLNTIKISRNPDCVVCGDHPQITELIDYEQFCGIGVQNLESAYHGDHDINSGELKELIKQGSKMMILDLREQIEFEISHIPTAVNVPFPAIESEMKKWDSSQLMVLVCQYGFLSEIAYRMFYGAGFRNAKNLKGGMRAWDGEASNS